MPLYLLSHHLFIFLLLPSSFLSSAYIKELCAPFPPLIKMESPSPTAKVLERQQSIKNEPRTLFGEEMELAREAALEVINNNTREQALKIFLEGLKPIKISSVMPKWELLDLEEVNQEFC